jgi:hypothetical protein
MTRWNLAACRTVDPDVMYPDTTAVGIAAAKKICRRCPIAAACLREALTTQEPHGVWGGLTAVERDRALNGYQIMRCHTCTNWLVPAGPNQHRCTACTTRRQQTRRPRHRAVDPWRTDITRWAASGMRDAEIAGRLGVTKSIVQRARFAWGVPAGETVRNARGVNPKAVAAVQAGRADWDALSGPERIQLWLRHEAAGGDLRSFQTRYGVGPQVASRVRRDARHRQLIAA